MLSALNRSADCYDRRSDGRSCCRYCTRSPIQRQYLSRILGGVLMALPTLTPEQRAAALAKAARARKLRSELLSAVKSGDLTVIAVFEKAESDDIVKKTKVSALLKSLPGVGPIKAAQLLEELSISDTRRIGGLGPNQR